MPSPFDINTPSTVVPLTGREGTATFTVRSVVRRKLNATAKFVTDPPNSPSAKWLSFVLPDGKTNPTDTSRMFDIDENKQYQVKILVPPDAKGGGYNFKLIVAEDTNPDDNFGESPAVTYTVAEENKPKLPIALIIAIITVILVIIIAIAAGLVINNNNQAKANATGTAVAVANLTAVVNQTATANAIAQTATQQATNTSGLDMLAAAPSADWSSAAGSLDFAVNPGDSRGAAFFQRNFTLEDGSAPAQVLETQEQWINNTGYIQGDFHVRLILSGQHFRVKLGFGQQLPTVITDGVTITISFNGTRIYNGVKIYDHTLKDIDIDMSQFAGESGTLVIRVGTNGTSYADWLCWVNPRIAFD